MLDNLLNLVKPTPELKFNVNHPNAMYDIACNIRTFVQEANIHGKELIILCIGTDRSTGDALGPLTGSKLKSLNQYQHIYGTLEEPVHATNLPTMLKFIEANFANPFIIAVDACLGRLESVGCVSLGRGPVKPGAAVNKELPPVGDCYVTGIVNVGGFMEHLVLQSTRLNLVFKMAETIAHGLAFAIAK